MKNEDKKNKAKRLKVRVKKDKVIERPPEERILSNEDFIPEFEEKVEHYVENYVEKVEKTKRLTLLAGVSFFMILIISLYAYSFKSQIKAVSFSDDEIVLEDSNIDKVKDDFSKLVESFAELKNIATSELSRLDIATTSTSTLPQALPESLDVATSSQKDSIEVLKDKLLNNIE